VFKDSYKIIILAVALILLTGLSGCGGSSPTENSDQTATNTDTPTNNDTTIDQTTDQNPTTDQLTGQNLLTIDGDTVGPNQSEKLDFANKKAQEWQSNAKLVAVQVEIPSSLKKESVSTRYIFSSPSVNYYYWTIAISADNTSYIRALIPKEDYLSANLGVILSQYWKVNYAEALQIADQNGGSTWRENNNLGQITLVLSRGQPNNYHYWNVEYVGIDKDGQRVDSNSFKVKISSYTGLVEE